MTAEEKIEDLNGRVLALETVISLLIQELKFSDVQFAPYVEFFANLGFKLDAEWGK